jgi:hypothetical protein
VSGYSATIRDVPEDVRKRVYEEYGIRVHRPREYEIDHLISLELGGSNSIKNLWPESYLTRPWNAHVKDALEDRLHALVCDGKMDLATAQRKIASDWIAAYKEVFHTDHPLSSAEKRTARYSVSDSPVVVELSRPGNRAPERAAGMNSIRPPDASAPSPQDAAGSEVWVNTRSGKFFRPGSRWYGRTKVGEYLKEPEAIQHGYEAAGGTNGTYLERRRQSLLRF